MHSIVDGNGLPLQVIMTPGQRQDSTCFEVLARKVRMMRSNGRRRWRPKRMAGDKACSCLRIRGWLRSHGIQGVIPQKENERRSHRGRPLKFDRDPTASAMCVERRVGWLEENRRIANRYEKLAINYLGMLKLAMMQRPETLNLETEPSSLSLPNLRGGWPSNIACRTPLDRNKNE
jgi:transposase